VVKVADFGHARDIYDKEYYKPNDKNRLLPIKWMAIESLQNYTFTVETDVWSYGVLLWELLTRGKKPYEGVDIRYMADYLKEHRLEKPPLAPDVIYAIMRSCWKVNPADRPTFTDIKQNLTNILATAEAAVTTRESNLTTSTTPSSRKNSYLVLSQRQTADVDMTYLTTGDLASQNYAQKT